MNIKASEYAQQKALVTRCRNEGIFIYSSENSLHFPIPPWFPDTIQKYIRTTLFKLIQQRESNGQLKGIPDLFIPELKLYIEMKLEGGVISDAQYKIHDKLRSLDYDVQVFYSAKDTWQYIESKKNVI